MFKTSKGIKKNFLPAFASLGLSLTGAVQATPLHADEKATAPSLSDLGFSKADTAADAQLQLTLEKRTSMLKTHQTLGLITALPMIATVLLGGSANRNPGIRNLHMALGITTAGLYGATASFALFAPKPPGIEDKGSTKIHRALAWAHGPLMVITPVLGGLAKSQRDQGEKVHGIASFHGTAAIALLASYLASIGVMTLNF